MSNIIVIVPPEWVKQDSDYLLGNTFDISWFESMQGHTPTDLNDRLDSLGFFTDDLRVQDILVINNEIYFKFG